MASKYKRKRQEKVNKMSEEKTCITPLDDLCEQALKHYDEISSEVCYYNSLIPKAIRFYQKNYKDKEMMVTLSMKEYVTLIFGCNLFAVKRARSKIKGNICLLGAEDAVAWLIAMGVGYTESVINVTELEAEIRKQVDKNVSK